MGTSDHLGVVATKYTRAPILKPKVVLKRSYKAFNVENFLSDINCSDINIVVTALDNVEDAACEFENKFRLILDQHAPLKVFQTRKNFSPYLSESTKSMMAARNSWKELAVKFGYKSAMKIVKDLGKDIKKAIVKDRKDYFNKDFGENCDRSNAWKTAKVILGVNNNSAPTVIKTKDPHGNYQEITNPLQLAELFNKFFKRKVDILREKKLISLQQFLQH